ncbi:hypothetical protein H7100_01835 [Candidatus Saccharibacteria bacterium]|nr:hypothetical protein [Candidatus Saccharibacteria bacterium]
MIKKPTKQQHLKHQKRHKIIIGLSIVVVAVLLGLIFALIVLPRTIDGIRLHRINAIYSSIELPANTYSETNDIFGDRRPYEYDQGRTMSSSKRFVVAQTVTETSDVVDKAIKAAGYMPFEEAYPGSVSKEFHYKTPDGAYIRLNVESKLRLDAFQNTYWMEGKLTDEFFKIDPNAGPSLVTLKVNLDDNNE